MKISSNTFQHEGYIPERCAFGIKDTENHMALGENKNPQLSWSEIPDNAKSCLLYTSPSPRDQRGSRMPSSA